MGIGEEGLFVCFGGWLLFVFLYCVLWYMCYLIGICIMVK